MSLVQTWFGPQFFLLHPALQSLHSNGGGLSGIVNIEFESGLAGRIGRALAGKLGIPTELGEHPLNVRIEHAEDGLHSGLPHRNVINQEAQIEIYQTLPRVAA